MRLSAAILAAGIVLNGSTAGSQSVNRVSGWRGDIDSLVARIDKSHPNPWAHRSRTAFMREASALRDSVATLSDGRILVGIMRLAASINDGHTGIADLGSTAAGNVLLRQPDRSTKETSMGLDDKIENKADDLKGKAKEATGKVTDDEELEGEGKVDQTKSSLKDAQENVKDALS